MKLFGHASLFCLAAIASGCATSDRQSRDDAVAELLADPRVGPPAERVCFASNIDRFTDSTPYSVVLSVSPSQDYLVTTRYCRDLERAQSLRLDSNMNCLARFDGIRIYETAFGTNSRGALGFNRCVVDEIYEWDADAAEDGGG
ncbi:DUF6491 family protein [uncultured Algimonas sp.]|uniref:DUF6491 family protein n=1 Tax=uncultured Algimonas sp. TaxID=1547920 RepID=UPI002629616A|nr:DUF6491 family protein [uncultured Algimonas sp.]